MGDEHLSTIPNTKLDELIKSSVENLVPNPSEFEDLSKDLSNIGSECNVPVCDDFTTISNPLFDADNDFSSNDDNSFSDKDVPKEIFKFFSNPLSDEEIISTKIDPHQFNAESDLIESLLNRDTSIVSSPKFDSLLDEFSGIENDDYDSEGDIFFLEELINEDSLLHPKNESFQFGHYIDLLSPRPPAKPSDDDGIFFDDEPDTGLLTAKVVGDISERYVYVPNVLPTQLTLCLVIDTLLLFLFENEDKVHLLSHRGFKAFKLFSESLMMINGGNIPILDVPFLHFYPP
nr:hypothetical protein [Tanacetum cinerariifolium]